jgi:hypothetical protein
LVVARHLPLGRPRAGDRRICISPVGLGQQLHVECRGACGRRDDGTVVIDLNELVRDFAVAAERAGIADWSRQLRIASTWSTYRRPTVRPGCQLASVLCMRSPCAPPPESRHHVARAVSSRSGGSGRQTRGGSATRTTCQTALVHGARAMRCHVRRLGLFPIPSWIPGTAVRPPGSSWRMPVS